MTNERTLRIYLSDRNRGEEWEWTHGILHISLELIFGSDLGLQHWDTMDTPIQVVNEATGNYIVFRQTWRGVHSMKYVAHEFNQGTGNIPMTIWKCKALFKHLDVVQQLQTTVQL